MLYTFSFVVEKLLFDRAELLWWVSLAENWLEDVVIALGPDPNQQAICLDPSLTDDCACTLPGAMSLGLYLQT